MYLPHETQHSLLPHIIHNHVFVVFLPIFISAIQVLPGGWVVSIVCLMIDLTDVILFSLVGGAKRAIA